MDCKLKSNHRLTLNSCTYWIRHNGPVSFPPVRTLSSSIHDIYPMISNLLGSRIGLTHGLVPSSNGACPAGLDVELVTMLASVCDPFIKKIKFPIYVTLWST